MTDKKAEKAATRQAYGNALVAIGRKNPNLIVMDADLSKSTMTAKFAEEFPDRFFNMGIAEQNLYGTACGLALSGKVVCASTFAMFAAGRAFEIIRNSIGYTHANVKICATHAGITVGEDGASHQTFEDIALMRTIPGMTVVNPCDAVSAEALMEQVTEFEGPCYVRLGRAAVPAVYDSPDDVKLGRGSWIKRGKDMTVVATGIMVSEAVEAARQLAGEGIDAGIIDMHTIKPIDEDILLEAAGIGPVVTAEEHSVIGGLGGAVAETLSKKKPVLMAMVGQQDTFGESGKPEDLKAKYGMTAEAIVKAARELAAAIK